MNESDREHQKALGQNLPQKISIISESCGQKNSKTDVSVGCSKADDKPILKGALPKYETQDKGGLIE
jgi:hypothetical protein